LTPISPREFNRECHFYFSASLRWPKTIRRLHAVRKCGTKCRLGFRTNGQRCSLLSFQHSIGRWQAGQVRLLDGCGENLFARRLTSVNPPVSLPSVVIRFPPLRTALQLLFSRSPPQICDCPRGNSAHPHGLLLGSYKQLVGPVSIGMAAAPFRTALDQLKFVHQINVIFVHWVFRVGHLATSLGLANQFVVVQVSNVPAIIIHIHSW
jgi:hypothetical protein